MLIDIREMHDKDGEQRPGKGIALKPENYNKIKVYNIIKPMLTILSGVPKRN